MRHPQSHGDSATRHPKDSVSKANAVVVVNGAAEELRFEVIRSKRGSAVKVVCKLGDQTLHCDRIDPAKASDRKRFAAVVVKAAGDSPALDVSAIDASLIDLAAQPDSDKPKPNSNQKTTLATTEGNELDASQVIRPELVIRDDFAAMAIPLMVENDGKVDGVWQLFMQRGNQRHVEVLTNRLPVNDGPALWLSPIPGTPTPQDVKRFNRWSKESRKSWLADASAPTTFEMLRMVAERIHQYVVLPDADAAGHALTLSAWVLMTYVYPMLSAVPYLYLAGPPNSGKTRTMDLLFRMVFRPFMTSNASAPVIFRTRHTFGGVLLLDEAERLRDTRSPDVAELLSILLAGYRRGGNAARMEPRGDGYQTVSFDCYGPAVLGCIKGLPPALSSRCITVRMIRASRADGQASRSLDDSPDEAQRILDALHTWALAYAHKAMEQPLPSTLLANRDLELWGPLLRIVSHTGDTESLDLLIDHAERMANLAADNASPEFDGLALTALYQLRLAGKVPTAGEVLAQAQLIDQEAFDSTWKPRMMGGILGRYFTSAKSNGRKVFRVDPIMVADIAKRYGYQVDGVDNE